MYDKLRPNYAPVFLMNVYSNLLLIKFYLAANFHLEKERMYQYLSRKMVNTALASSLQILTALQVNWFIAQMVGNSK